MSLHKYVIVTTSTGGWDAALRVDTYIDGVLTTQTPMPYRTYSGSWLEFDGLIKVGYNVVVSGNWTCQILGDIKDHTVGENISWSYTYSQNLTLEEAPIGKFLIESQGDYYTISNNTPVNIGSTLNAQLFLDYGLDEAPSYSDYSSLTAPSILVWNAEESVPIQATTRGVPTYPQTVISQNIEMISPTVTGVDSVDINSDADTLFAMSFDDGSTWYNYVNNQWVLLTTSTAGQTRESVEDIPTNAWNAKVTNRQLMFRFTLLDENGYVTQIKVNFTN